MWPHSIRYGREVGTTMLIFIMAMAYAATSPIILPFALAYFIITWSAAPPSTTATPGLPGPLWTVLAESMFLYSGWAQCKAPMVSCCCCVGE